MKKWLESVCVQKKTKKNQKNKTSSKWRNLLYNFDLFVIVCE